MGQFDLLSAFYGLATAIYIFVIEFDVNWMIVKIRNEEKKTGMHKPSHVTKERTKYLQEFVAILYGAVPIFAYVFFNQFFVYNGVWWFPYFVAVPGTIFALFYAFQLRVYKFDDNGAHVTSIRPDIDSFSGLFLYLFVTMLPFYWPIVSIAILTKLGYTISDWYFFYFQIAVAWIGWFSLMMFSGSKIFTYDEVKSL